MREENRTQSQLVTLRGTLIFGFISVLAFLGGWFLMLYGGIGLDHAQHTGEPTALYKFCLVLAQLLWWPVFGIAWLAKALDPAGVTRLNVISWWAIPTYCLGYLALGFVTALRCQKKRNSHSQGAAS